MNQWVKQNLMFLGGFIVLAIGITAIILNFFPYFLVRFQWIIIILFVNAIIGSILFFVGTFLKIYVEEED